MFGVHIPMPIQAQKPHNIRVGMCMACCQKSRFRNSYKMTLMPKLRVVLPLCYEAGPQLNAAKLHLGASEAVGLRQGKWHGILISSYYTWTQLIICGNARSISKRQCQSEWSKRRSMKGVIACLTAHFVTIKHGSFLTAGSTIISPKFLSSKSNTPRAPP